MSIADITRALAWQIHYRHKLQEIDHKNQWEIARLLAAYVASPYAKQKITNLQTFLPLPWDTDKVPEKVEMSEAERKALFAKWDAEMLTNG